MGLEAQKVEAKALSRASVSDLAKSANSGDLTGGASGIDKAGGAYANPWNTPYNNMPENPELDWKIKEIQYGLGQGINKSVSNITPIGTMLDSDLNKNFMSKSQWKFVAGKTQKVFHNFVSQSTKTGSIFHLICSLKQKLAIK